MTRDPLTNHVRAARAEAWAWQRNWDLPDDGTHAVRSTAELDALHAEWGPDARYIEADNGPAIVAVNAEQETALRALIADNGRRLNPPTTGEDPS